MQVFDNLHRKTKQLLSGLYGLMLETVHSDGHQDEEETMLQWIL